MNVNSTAEQVKIGRLQRRIERLIKQRDHFQKQYEHFKYVMEIVPYYTREYKTITKRNDELKRVYDLEQRVEEQALLIQKLTNNTKEQQ